jgi:anaerobic ribonucleoside-triphosphate reductase
MLKCNKCHLIFKELIDKCPECNDELIVMCENDKMGCSCGVVAGLKVCEICGEFICPTCGCHSVTAVSRVTGYLQDVSGWNLAKKTELVNRHRYEV